VETSTANKIDNFQCADHEQQWTHRLSSLIAATVSEPEANKWDSRSTL